MNLSLISQKCARSFFFGFALFFCFWKATEFQNALSNNDLKSEREPEKLHFRINADVGIYFSSQKCFFLDFLQFRLTSEFETVINPCCTKAVKA